MGRLEEAFGLGRGGRADSGRCRGARSQSIPGAGDAGGRSAERSSQSSPDDPSKVHAVGPLYLPSDRLSVPSKARGGKPRRCGWIC